MRTLCKILLLTGIIIAQPPPGNFIPPSYPQTISFQAMTSDTLGNSFEDGIYNFSFRISRPAQGGAEVFWEESKQVDVVDGLINTVLGSENPIVSLPFRDDLILTVALNNELIAVTSLTSVPFSLTSHLSLNAMHADTAYFTHHADTAHFAMNAPMSDSSLYAHQAGHAMRANEADSADYSNEAGTADYATESYHSTFADTAHFVMTAPMSDTAHYATHAGNADTANYVNLSSYNGSIGVIKDDDAKVTIFSSDDNSSSYLTLISQTSTGIQRELRVINEGNVGGGFRFYDATNGDDLMVIDTSGKMGLGVSIPSEKLEISDGNIALDNDHSYMSKNSNGVLVGVLRMDSNDDIKLGHYSGANDLYLRANGNCS